MTSIVGFDGIDGNAGPIAARAAEASSGFDALSRQVQDRCSLQ
jgi:hypothetical protein